MKKVLVVLTDELWVAIDGARGETPRNPWLERELWRLKAIRTAAAELGVENPRRPLEGRGGDRRKKDD